MPIQDKCTQTYPLWGQKGPINNDQIHKTIDIIGYTRLTPFFGHTLVNEQHL
jgi:hypothetical protein